MGGSDPASAYAMTLPRGSMRPQGGLLTDPTVAPGEPGLKARPMAPEVGGAENDYALAAPSGEPGLKAPERPSVGLGTGTAAPEGYGPEWMRKAGARMAGVAPAGQGNGSNQRQGESLYAPAPSMISPGLAGSGGGRDVDLTKFMRAFARR